MLITRKNGEILKSWRIRSCFQESVDICFYQELLHVCSVEIKVFYFLHSCSYISVLRIITLLHVHVDNCRCTIRENGETLKSWRIRSCFQGSVDIAPLTSDISDLKLKSSLKC